MSTFNKRKDRYPNGKPKSHRHSPVHWVGTNPGRWNRLFTTKRRRASERIGTWKVLSGFDPDGISWMPDRHPTSYYW